MAKTSKKQKSGTPPIEVATEKFWQNLAIGKPDLALRDVEHFFSKHPSESTVPLFITVKHFVAFHTADFKERLASAIDRGRERAIASAQRQHDRKEGT